MLKETYKLLSFVSDLKLDKGSRDAKNFLKDVTINPPVTDLVLSLCESISIIYMQHTSAKSRLYCLRKRN